MADASGRGAGTADELLIVGIVALLRWALASGGASRRKEGGRSLALLKERYARGEIDKTEFEGRKRDLA